ncbi:MAG: hypothetical protein AAFX10_12835, partial [Pseudomonadota bacterium]
RKHASQSLFGNECILFFEFVVLKEVPVLTLYVIDEIAAAAEQAAPETRCAGLPAKSALNRVERDGEWFNSVAQTVPVSGES